MRNWPVSRTGKPAKKHEISGALRKLGEIAVFRPIPREKGYALQLSVAFGQPTFEWGEYTATIGLTHAVFALSHPGFEATDHYQSFLDQKSFKQQSKEKTSSETKLGFRARLGLLIGGAGVSASAEASRDKSASTETQISAKYALVSRQAERWIVGANRGDPRQPLSDEMPACLAGTYFDGDGGADATGVEIKVGKTSSLALCVLTPKTGANDTTVAGLLIAPVKALQIVISKTKSPETGISEKIRDEENRQLKLREAIARICVEKVAAMEVADRSTIEAQLLSGELLISEKKQSLHIAPSHGVEPAKARPAKSGTEVVE